MKPCDGALLYHVLDCVMGYVAEFVVEVTYGVESSGRIGIETDFKCIR